MSKFYILILVFVFLVGGCEGIKCKLCESLQTKICASNPESVVGFCELTEKCFAYVDDSGITRRDCAGPAKCEEPNCKSCNTENCNTQTVPEDRKLCVQCEGKEAGCTTPDSSVKPTPCQHYKTDDSCFTYVSDDGSTYRGCASDDLKVCKDNATLCINCNDNGCNTQPATKKQTCLECSSTSDNGKLCKRPENPGNSCNITISQKCEETVLLGREAKCYTQFDGEVVTRGCGSKNLPDQGHIETCKEPDCNNDCALEPSCYVCDSTNSAGCKTTQLDTFSKKCTNYSSSCIICENQDVSRIVRSCDQDAPKDLICNSCRGDNCNKDEKLPKSCYTCDSKLDAKCTENDGIGTKFCSSTSQKCYVKLNADGTTIRGCIEETDCKDGCKTCNGHKCNTEVVAKGLIQCYKCNNADDCAKNQQVIKSTASQCSAPGDSCYMISKDDKIMQRGCLSDTDVPSECKNNDTKCVKCRTPECNSPALKGSPDLKCIQCKDDSVCPWRHLPKTAEVCENEILYTQQELCYTLILADGSTERGCLSQQSQCTLQNRDCRICYDDACNTQATKTFKCVRCRSDIEPECKKSKPNISPSLCVNTPTNATLGCYSEYDDGVIIRGCLADMGDIARAECSRNKLCTSCFSEGCNNIEVKNSSSMISASVSIVVWSLLIMGQYLR